jgi:hypothetical protein
MDVKERLEGLTPETERLPHWDAVLRDARPSRARWAAPRLAVVGTVVAIAALVAVAPWREGERTGILDRALAAVGDGDVLHVVFRGEWGGTVISLETGKRTPAYGEREVWYDPERELVRQVSRLGGVVQGDEVFTRKAANEELTTLWQDYRGALESGQARIAGPDVIDGVPVLWIVVRSEMLPDVADGKDHEFAQQVAISRESYKPVAMRYTRDGKAPEGVTERILQFETISRDEADFTRSARPQGPVAIREGRTPTTLAQADEILGRDPYWLGSSHGGLPLAQVARLEVATGRVPDGQTRPQFTDEHLGVVLFYGSVGDDPTVYGRQSVPRADRPFVSVTQTTDRDLMVRGTPTAYVPPAGSVLVTARRFGLLVVGGVHVSITARDEAAVLAAARALRRVSAESGAGE